ncbi:MAG: ParB/RepB/Spo0J family partition protein [Acidobacteria bacterium]|nr:MAG: ParB/RepB/Spo0J family partition protein [Acidobacteriota bacterium]REK01428.1 MAG: ParB/RepB/Spo0J family partition protein [Acidobacteriota bacterium]REK14384.1 MAG: ParB/RepB/Spo0J family partition protein [Acidobacteriota bacterium]REK45099.1 MAG: ParB/RepB/Spo0J family partition protein [Acidobacteriota bacterium]
MRHDSHYVEELSKANRSLGKMISIDKIEPNPDQPRSEIGDLTELSASIKSKGVLEPLLVKPRDDGSYMIIAGERRWHASKQAGLQEVPCIELDIDENSIAEIALIENMQRKDLTIWEVADGLLDLAVRFGYTHDDIAEKIGKSRTTVTESIAIAGLPKPVRERCSEAGISAKSVLIEVSRQFDEDAMHKLLDEIEGQDLKRTEIRDKVRTEKSPSSKTPKKKAEKPDEPDPGIEHSREGNDADDILSVETSEPDHSNLFEYSSYDGTFDLRVNFNTDDEYSRKEVLLALKEAFEAVKAGHAGD